jgi:plastocyanin
MQRVFTSAVLGRLLPAALVALAIAACGETHVGSSNVFNFTDRPAASTPVATATPVPTPTPPPAVHAETQPPAVVHTAPPVATATPRPAAQFGIAINGDNSGQPQFQPTPVRVYVGTIIVFTNNDSVARSVAADSGAFNSGSIAPGKTWTYTASTIGTFDFHDGTRPYAVGTLQVVGH